MIWIWVFLYRIDIATRALRRGLRNVRRACQFNAGLHCAAVPRRKSNGTLCLKGDIWASDDEFNA